MAIIDASGLIPTTQSAQVIQTAIEQSVVLTRGRRQAMPSGAASVPILNALPNAGFVGAGVRKPYTDLAWSNQVLKAEEVAATVAIPQAYIEDAAINVWAEIRPLLGEAIAIAVDNAVLFGTGAPASFPAGGILAGLTPVAAGTDVVDTVNQAMAQVEGKGLPVTGHVADLIVKSLLRGVRDTNGALLLGLAQVNGTSIDTLYGVPISWSTLSSATIDFVTGDWDMLVVGVRQDVRYELSSDGVIADPAGVVLVSAFQDDVVLMRVYMRLGVALARPMGRRGRTQPFAVANLSGHSTAPFSDEPAEPQGEEADAEPATAGSSRRR